MPETLRSSRTEIAVLLEEASHPQRLDDNDLGVEVLPLENEGGKQLYNLVLIDQSTKLVCAEIGTVLENGKVVASKATLHQAYTGLKDRQRALILANIFHYAEETDPLIHIHFAETIDREREEIKEFQDYIRNKPPKLFTVLERTLGTQS